MKTKEQAQARALREQGWSVKEIEHELRVSRSSVSVWVRDVELGPEASERLQERAGLGARISAQRKAAAFRAIRQAYQDVGRERARSEGAGYAAGCMLFWAEGEKCRNSAKLANSDPEVLRLFATFLRRYFRVSNDRMRLRCNLFADHSDTKADIEAFWLCKLGLDRSSLKKSAVNVFSKHSQKKRTNKLPYGTAELSVHSTEIVQTIYGSIQEYGGFERPEWLD